MSNCHNPFHEQDPSQPPTIDRTLNLQELLQSTKQRYQDAGVPEWAQALPNTLTFPPDQLDLIKRELKEGALPLLLPSSSIQLQTLVQALTRLKPLSINDTGSETVEDPYIWDDLRTLMANQDPSLITNIPAAPYFVFTKPTQRLPEDTTQKTLDQQKTHLATLQRTHPKLDALQMAEYAALQFHFTRDLQATQLRQGSASLSTITPLDKDTWTSFPHLPVSRVGLAPSGDWYPDGRRLGFGRGGAVRADALRGFRLAVRVALKS